MKISIRKASMFAIEAFLINLPHALTLHCLKGFSMKTRARERAKARSFSIGLSARLTGFKCQTI